MTHHGGDRREGIADVDVPPAFAPDLSQEIHEVPKYIP